MVFVGREDRFLRECQQLASLQTLDVQPHVVDEPSQVAPGVWSSAC